MGASAGMKRLSEGTQKLGGMNCDEGDVQGAVK